MRKVSTVFEMVLSCIPIALGIYFLRSGYSDSSRNSTVMLPLGALLFVAGAVWLANAIRSRVWHYRMMRERPLETSGPMSGLSHHG